MRILTIILTFLILPFVGSSQNDTINQKDENGLKQGHWIYYGKDKPQYGYPANVKMEEGRYVNDRKEGLWIKYFKDGVTIKLKGHYIDNRPNGKYFKYYRNEQLKEEGVWAKFKYQGVIRSYYENGQLKFLMKYNEKGNFIDTVYFYFETGCMEFIEIFSHRGVYSKTITYKQEECNVIEDTVNSNMFYRSRCYSGKMREVEYRTSRKSDNKDLTINTTDSIEVNDKSMDIRGCVIGSGFRENGYNKVFYENDEVWQDGEFKNGILWNGKVYVYDDDGILLRVKVYKKGKYHSDGQL